MKSQTITKVKEASKVTVGSVLIAQPFWKEEIYKRSIILITDHNNAYGTRGIIINKVSDIPIGVALPEMNTWDSIYLGGLTAPRMITCVHSIREIPEADDLGFGLFIGGDTEHIREKIEKDEIDLKKIKFCAGVVEWSAGEVNHEVSEKKWWVSKITADALFDSPAEELWSSMLMQMGNLYGIIAHLPDPVFN